MAAAGLSEVRSPQVLQHIPGGDPVHQRTQHRPNLIAMPFGRAEQLGFNYGGISHHSYHTEQLQRLLDDFQCCGMPLEPGQRLKSPTIAMTID